MTKVLANGSALVSHGPLHMTVSVFRGHKPSYELARKGGKRGLDVLRLLTRFLPIMRISASEVKRVENLPLVVQMIIGVTQSMVESDLTSMACVAGATADEVADFLEEQGGRRIIVNNGGDIALRLRPDEKVRIGVRIDRHNPVGSYTLVVEGGSGIGGVATSGLGGRSLTKGIASAAVAIAPSAAMADAAATTIANATLVEDQNIKTEWAETVHPDTDIPGQRIVTHVGDIGREKRDEGLEGGLERASLLVNQGLIMGAIIAIKGEVRFTEHIVANGQDLHVRRPRFPRLMKKDKTVPMIS